MLRLSCMAELASLAHATPPSPPSPESPSLSKSRHGRQNSISSLLRLQPRLCNYPNLSLLHIKQIQGHLYRRSLFHDRVLVTQLIAACSTAGATDYIARLFRSVPEPDIIILNTMLKAFTVNSLNRQAVAFYVTQVLGRCFAPDCFTFPCLLKACAALKDLSLGRQIHAYLIKNQATCADVSVLNSVVDMYFKCHENESARKAFEGIKEPNSTSWNMMLSGLVKSGDMESARWLFDEMPHRDIVAWNILMSAFVKKGDMTTAQDLFNEMPERDTISWNVLIAGYTVDGQNDKALAVFSQMISSGIRPDNATMLSVASASSASCLVNYNLVDEIIGLLKSMNSVPVSTALLTLYAKVGRVHDARGVFDQIPEKDLVAWNAMIAAYAQNKRPVEAIELFQLMQQSNYQLNAKPDSITMVSLIRSCSQIGISSLGEWVHAYIRRKGLGTDIILTTALIDMYAKCGDLSRSRQLFAQMRNKDLASWNAMIKGLAIHGQGREALELLFSMEKDGIVPNHITFVGLLSACCHGGLVAEGLELFELLQKRYNLVPCIEHYGSVVDLLGRAGKLDEAYMFVKKMPIEPDTVVWGSLLGACRSYQNLQLAEEAAEKLLDLDPGNDGHYVLLSNVYASTGKWAEARKVRALMKARHVQKKPGCSAVELNGVIHQFRAGERSHPRSREIYEAWDELAKRLKKIGYEPANGMVIKNLNEEDKEEALYRHSEKLALAFVLISSEERSPVRIVKNLRICIDCHRAMELASELENREITVRDRTRFHHFRAGRCSCGGFW